MQEQNKIAHNIEEKQRTKDVLLDENVSFTSLMLSERVFQGLNENGFTKPSPIQLKSIPLAKCGFDLIVKSKSGTGKTLVFAITALETINEKRNQLQALILVPTREIAVQIEDVIKCIGQKIEGLNVGYFIGGMPIELDVQKIKQCHIAIGCPGRIKHLLSLQTFETNNIRLFVLDEADKLFESSFENDINEIYNALPQRKQVIATSATYPQQLETFLAKYMLSPTYISIEIDTPILLGIKQFVSIIKEATTVVQQMQAKNDLLVQILSRISFTQCLIFSNFQTRAESVSNYLNQKGWNTIYISAAQSQNKRLEAINNLKEFKNRILLSTDLTARGIDAPNVDLVINYDIPQETVTYLHRMGRAGRYGSAGICINLCINGNELELLQHILATIGPNISISILPELKEKNFNVFTIDTSSLEQINGKMSTNLVKTSKDDIKTEILKSKEGSKPKKSNRKQIEVAKLSECDVKSLLTKSQKELDNVINDKLSDNEETAQSLFMRMANTAKNAEEEGYKKRKRASLNEQQQEMLRKDKRKVENLSKNTALLNTTKLLVNPNANVDSDLINSIEKHLTIIKSDNDEEIFKENLKSEDLPAPNNNDVNYLEDIFVGGFDCAINDKNWIENIPAKEYEEFKKNTAKEESDCGEDYEEEDFQEEFNDDFDEPMTSEDVEENVPDPLKWIPVVRTSNTTANDAVQQDYYQHQQEVGLVNHGDSAWNAHFQRYYQECSDNLWQQGLTFESVAGFDNWFHQWQQQLKGVTSYVQQNIYVHEMSNFQQNQWHNPR